jgi:GTP-binding protein
VADKIIISSAEFVESNTDVEKCPKPFKPEYAFIGRSNVGKSSLINMLTGKKKLAKTSATPGKTQLINHFLINDKWYLVDLPGYGFAKVSKSSLTAWNNMIHDYLLKRKNLLSVFVLIDARLEPQKNDLSFVHWLGEKEIPFVIAFTKADKLARQKLINSVANFKKELLKTWEELPPVFVTSAEMSTGREDVLNYIEETNKIFKK